MHFQEDDEYGWRQQALKRQGATTTRTFGALLGPLLPLVFAAYWLVPVVGRLERLTCGASGDSARSQAGSGDLDDARVLVQLGAKLLMRNRWTSGGSELPPPPRPAIDKASVALRDGGAAAGPAGNGGGTSTTVTQAAASGGGSRHLLLGPTAATAAGRRRSADAPLAPALAPPALTSLSTAPLPVLLLRRAAAAVNQHCQVFWISPVILVAGLAVGAVGLFAVVAAAILCLVRRRKKDAQSRPTGKRSRHPSATAQPVVGSGSLGASFDVNALGSGFSAAASCQQFHPQVPSIIVPAGSKITVHMPSATCTVPGSHPKKWKVSDGYYNQIFGMKLRRPRPGDPIWALQYKELALLTMPTKGPDWQAAVLGRRKGAKECEVHSGFLSRSHDVAGYVSKDGPSTYSLLMCESRDSKCVLKVAVDGPVEDRQMVMTDPASGALLARALPDSVGKEYYNLECYHPADLVSVVITAVGIDRLG